jgi:hypothetical protein
MSIENLVLLPTSTVGAFTGTKQKGAGHHWSLYRNKTNEYNDGIHTFVVSFRNWSGELKLQGTLELYPGDADWFDLKDLNDTTIVFGDGSTDYDDSYTVNSKGKFIWVRAVGTVTAGEITQIRFKY